MRTSPPAASRDRRSLIGLLVAAGVTVGCGETDDGITASMSADAEAIAAIGRPEGWEPEALTDLEGSTVRTIEDSRVLFAPDSDQAVVLGWVSPDLVDDAAVDDGCAALVAYVSQVVETVDPDDEFADLPTVDTCRRTTAFSRTKTGPMLASLSSAPAGERTWYIGTTVEADDAAGRITVNISSSTDPAPRDG